MKVVSTIQKYKALYFLTIQNTNDLLYPLLYFIPYILKL